MSRSKLGEGNRIIPQVILNEGHQASKREDKTKEE